MNNLNEIVGRYAGAFATGALAVLGVALAAGQPISQALVLSAVSAGLVAVWKLSLRPPSTEPKVTQLVAVATQTPKENS